VLSAYSSQHGSADNIMLSADNIVLPVYDHELTADNTFSVKLFLPFLKISHSLNRM
jgi:hypothetical protein